MEDVLEKKTGKYYLEKEKKRNSLYELRSTLPLRPKSRPLKRKKEGLDF